MDVQVKNYQFNKTARTITFSDYDVVRLDSLRMIVNVTAGAVLYTLADPLLSCTVDGNVVTLAYDTNLMNDSDALQIIYNDESIWR